MNIGIVTPAPKGSRAGNRITTLRWARILRELGHRVSISQKHDDEPRDVLIALHARRSHSAIAQFRRNNPDAPIIVALTGTDVYRDIHVNRRAQKSLTLADRIVVLQPRALRELTSAQRDKATVIYQSVDDFHGRSRSNQTTNRSPSFDVCVIGHLRPVKDPLRAAFAARSLPETSKVRILHVGGAMTKQMEQRARREMRINPRYRWLGELSRPRTLRILAASRLTIISSRIEGGANILSETIVAQVPVLASRIDGNVGILGSDYPGLFRVGDTQQLARLMTRAEADPKLLSELKIRVQKLAPLFDPKREQMAWANLIRELRN